MVHRGRLHPAIALGLALVLARVTFAGGPYDEGQPAFVPWKLLNPGDAPVTSGLVLYWIPASREEIRHSPLLTSRPLTALAGQCVAMKVVRPDDSETIERLGVTGAPAAVLAEVDGTVVARTGGAMESLSCAAVEKMVRATVASRETELERLLDLAADRTRAGDREGAVELYRRVCAQRCLSPRRGRTAERALRKLGVSP
jgi:hypothetical protein